MEPERGTDPLDRETPPSQLWVRLSRYLVGDLTDHERSDVERWLAADTRRAAAIAELRTAWAQHPETRTAVDVERALRALTQHIGIGEPMQAGFRRKTVRPAFPQVGTRTQRRRAWSAVVGVVIGTAVIVAGWKLGVGRVLRRARATESVYTTYVTANGQRATIMLPDGNRVALDVASRLEVPTNYGAGNHAVRLPVGEALFMISHHAGTPFTVMAGSATARVLGTTFLVRHYGTSPLTVAVSEGKVAVGTAVVTAQRQIEISQTGVLQMSPADASQFSFATGILTLNSVRLADAVKELNRWYDADIRLGDSALANRLVYGKFTAGSLADLSEVLEWTFAVHVVRVGRVLTLYPRVK